MSWWPALVWGSFGSICVVGLDFVAAVARIGDWPWKSRKKLRGGPYAAAAVVRLLVGAGVAAASAQSGMVPNALSALSIGVATPLIIEKLGTVGQAYGQAAGTRNDST